MGLKLNEAIPFKVYFVDKNGTPITGATVNVIYYDESNNLTSGETATEIGNGWYFYSLTPDVAGAWGLSFSVVSGGRTYGRGFTFWVGKGQEKDIQTETDKDWTMQPLELLNQTTVIQNTWYPSMDTQVNCKVYKMAVRQVNDETDNKNVQFRFTIDGETWGEANRSIANNTLFWVHIVIGDTAVVIYTQTNAYTSIMGYGGVVEGASVKIESRLTSVPGTNQVLKTSVLYALKE